MSLLPLLSNFIPGMLAFAGILLGSPDSGGKSLDYYVSPGGSDSAAGTMDAPFATIHHARLVAIDAITKSNPLSVQIWLMEGIHTLTQPLEFYSQDNQNGRTKLSFRAFPGAQPVVSGGLKLSDWSQNPQAQWVTTIPDGHQPRELFVNGHRAIRARHPNTGYLRMDKVGEDRRTNFFFGANDFPISTQLEGLEVVVFHDWSVSRMPVRKIDPAAKQITAIDSIGAKGLAFFNLDNWEENPRYYLENAMEFLDMEMEWFFDSESGKLSLILPGNQNPQSMDIVIPVLDNLITFSGSREAPVRHITFQGITFSHCAWLLPDRGYNGIQACHFDDRSQVGQNGWAVVPAAVTGEWMSNVRFEDCRFSHLGGSGLWMGAGSVDCQVSGCHFEDISGNGIMIGEGRDRMIDGRVWYEVVPEDVATGNLVENSTIRNCGVQFYGAVGIWCGLTAETMIRENHIYDLTYTGISIGWMWNPTPTPCRDNTIKNNHIHHIMQVLSDGGGIYSLGLQPGSRLTGNRIHDVRINTGRAESNGTFLDEGTTDVLIEGNMIYNIARSPLRFHRAGENFVQNNWLFTSPESPAIRYNTTPEDNITKDGNLIFEVEENPSDSYFTPYIDQWQAAKNP